MADEPLDVLILWHMHQPFYKNLRTGRMAMPWVRMHGTKDYLDMTLIAEEFAGVHVNINWVPSLLDQIEDYARGEATDDELDLSRAVPEEMDEEARVALLKTHFVGYWPTMIDPYPRYKALREKHGGPKSDAEWRAAARQYTAQELRDVQVWMNLAWIDPLLRQRDPFLLGLTEKGQNFSEDEKRELLEKQRGILAEIIPAAARAWDRGSIEISTTPYCHPILPLLYDTDIARRARRDMPLPKNRFSYPEDAEAQIRAALDRAEQLFGRRPVGMWPSEGSVCDELTPILARAGVRWIATDEEVLALSLGMDGFARDKHGNALNPDLLYRAYRRRYEGEAIDLVFRDHAASDLIGFQFSNWPAEQAAEALIARLEEAQRKLQKSHGPHAATIILDGENCWEYYKDDGAPFLRAFYERLAGSERLRSRTIAEHLALREPTELPALHSGSWINHDFGVWIGHSEDNLAWDLLCEAREAYQRRIESPEPLDPKAADLARQSLWIAEGSDWNWWYGDEHDSGNDAAFDALYREHLANIYRFLGLTPPARLETPIVSTSRASGVVAPSSFVSPEIDGRPTSFYEWFGAGAYDPAHAGGAMRQTSESLLGRLYFGFDRETLYLRVDLAERRRWRDSPLERATIWIFSDHAWKIEARGAREATQAILWREIPGQGWQEAGAVDRAVADLTLELAVPFAQLGLAAEDRFGVQVELCDPGGQPERQPAQTPIALSVPGEDFEAKRWLL